MDGLKERLIFNAAFNIISIISLRELSDSFFSSIIAVLLARFLKFYAQGRSQEKRVGPVALEPWTSSQEASFTTKPGMDTLLFPQPPLHITGPILNHCST